ncbi:LysE family translocator [Pseudovibrio japonicus]|uniref:LysE family translocator n=1 Tax=Pseudovibrio japonicus TaxID=366534 RepID=UPI00167C3471|nr:LysE family translocator [Pseudovibrio japonicus]
MTFETWALFALTITVASISPGPNVLIVIVNTLKFGAKGALFTIVGNLVCLFCVALLAAIGVGTMIQMTPIAFTIMKLVGGSYLAWMGFKIIRSSFSQQTALSIEHFTCENSVPASYVLAFQAFLVSASNPKSILFLTAVFPQFLDLNAPITSQFSIMFATIIGLVLIIHGAYAVLATNLRNRPMSKKLRNWMARFTGTTFIGLGASVALSK